jgi:hypothetical protein
MANQLLDSSLGFKQSFGTITRTTDIAVYIVVDRSGFHTGYGVYLSHGVAGGRFWRNSAPLVRKETLAEAKDVAATLFGIAGSGEFAEVVEY